MLKKYVKNCVFASFQGNLACSWPGNKATDSFLTYSAKDTLFWTKRASILDFFA